VTLTSWGIGASRGVRVARRGDETTGAVGRIVNAPIAELLELLIDASWAAQGPRRDTEEAPQVPVHAHEGAVALPEETIHVFLRRRDGNPTLATLDLRCSHPCLCAAPKAVETPLS
jgi:hypothetical protein